MAREAAVIGWGYSELSRDSSDPLGGMAIEACTNALKSAGLSPSDVDGVCTFPNVPYGYPYGYGLTPPRQGIDVVGCGYLVDRMGLDRVRWFAEVSDGMLAGAIVEGIGAIEAGGCEVVLVWRAMHYARENYSKFPSVEATGAAQFAAPYGLVSVIQWHGLAYRMYLERYGKDRSGTAALAVQSRRFASKNDNAFFRGQPLTEDDYYAARMISSPLGLFDCDIPVQGCGAVVLAASSVAQGGGRRIARVAGYAQGSYVSDGRPNFVVEDQISVGERTTRRALERAGVSIEDVDVARNCMTASVRLRSTGSRR